VAANSIPVKMFKSKDLMKELNNKWIVPIHVQLIPTNKCNLKCKFCSCSDRKKNLELSLNQIEEIADNLSMVHCAAVTITGGGEPLLHPKINEIIDLFYHRNIKIGLVTNGYLASRLSKESWYKITWCRISGSDDRAVPLKMLPIYDKIDWAFSYVVTKDFKLDNLLEYINFANNNGFTHVRVVSDILDDKLEMFHVKQLVTKSGVNLSKVIFQDRSEYTTGMKNCYISLLKPNIAADGYIYPCCLDGNETVLIEKMGLLINKQIKDVEIGDKIYNNGGRIINKFKKENTEILKITLKNNREILASKDHIFFTLNKFKSKNKRNKNIYNAEIIETKSEYLKIGDLLPVAYNIKNAAVFDSSSYNYEVYIQGKYIADGWHCKKKKQVGFMFGKHKNNSLFFEILNRLDIKYKVYERRTGVQVSCYDKKMFNLIFKCGERALNKTIPDSIFNMTDDLKINFIKSYISSDGYIQKPSKSFNNYKVKFSTISKKLADDFVLLLSTLGVIANIKLVKRECKEHYIEGRKVNQHDLWLINISGSKNLEKLQFPFIEKSRDVKRNISYLKDDKFMYVPIKSIEKVMSKNGLYDIQISGNPSFISSFGILTHNCGVQYALDNPSLDFPESMRMGHYKDLFHILHAQRYFNGSVCKKCFYSNYNNILQAFIKPLKHEEFV
jgi:organic radical activating enzyme